MKYPLSLLLVALALASCTPGGSGNQTTPLAQSTIHLISPQGERIAVSVEIAADSASQAKGLMGRKTLAPDAGMIFLFRGPQQLGFWMKNTLIPLDIVFFRPTGEVVSFATMVPCPPASSGADQCPTTFSSDGAQYALEVPAGFIRRYGITGGWKLAIQPWMTAP